MITSPTRTSAGRHAGPKSPTTRWASVVAVAVMILSSVVTAATATTVYEIQGRWAASTPATVSKGSTVVSEWRFNINDDAAAPGNVVIPNTTVTFQVQNGKFTVLPVICLTTGVSPASSISADGTSMTCNLGDRAEGTAELVLTGIEVTGATGQLVSISGSIGGVTATTPPLPIINTFAMDMKWDAGTPASSPADSSQLMSFAWSLRHAPGAEPGPASVTYRVTVNPSNNEAVVARPASLGGACTPIVTSQPTHPYSGSTAGANASNTAPFPTCTMVRVGTTNQYDVTISGIDYSKTTLPVNDTRGTPLSTAWDVVAAGTIHFQMTYANPGTFSISANAPTYTSALGATSSDDTTNNTNRVSYTRGVWTGAWDLRRLNPPLEGTFYNDSFRQLAGQPAIAISGVGLGSPSQPSSATCTVLDTRYVSFESTQVGTMALGSGVVVPYQGVQPTISYFVGTGVNNVLVPTSPTYDPNGWQCDTANESNWLSAPPADLSQVRAVRVVYPASMQIGGTIAQAFTRVTIKPGAAIGQDIYTWTSYRLGATWTHPHRTLNPADVPGGGSVLSAGSRYAYVGGGRDVLRVVGAQPVIDKVAGQTDSLPGATIGYTIRYRAESIATVQLPQYTLVDVLPLGVAYVPGSATEEPDSITTLPNGRVELRWVFDDVTTNQDYFMHYDVVLPADAQPGQRFTNDASASIGQVVTRDTAVVRIREGGSTFLTKTAQQDVVPHQGGVAQGGWTVRMTSADSVAQTFTDTIDVLPYNGDGRGTDFSGSYALSGPIDVSGMPAGTTVYYTSAAPATVSDDPKDASNGGSGTITGNTVGWSTTFTADATAVRVIGGILAPSASQSFVVNITTAGAAYEDVYVNRAQAVTNRTNLVMRTSDLFTIAGAKSLVIKKYVQDGDGDWRDANNIDDYPAFAQGSALNYRLVVTNTGDVPIADVTIEDDKVDLAALDPLPAGLGSGAVIAELLPGEDNAVTIEYTVPLTGVSVGQTLVNNACAVPDDSAVDESCDPAGVTVLPSSLAWSKVAAGTDEFLAGSEWALTPVDADGEPLGAETVVVDCIAPDAAVCTDADADRRAGRFRVEDLEAGRYRLVETQAPAGYVLDQTPRYIEVTGDTSLQEPIENDQQEALIIPLTGGQSRELFAVVAGSLAMLLLGLLLFRHRPRRRQRGLDSVSVA